MVESTHWSRFYPRSWAENTIFIQLFCGHHTPAAQVEEVDLYYIRHLQPYYSQYHTGDINITVGKKIEKSVI